MLNRSPVLSTERGTAAVAAAAGIHVREDSGGAGYVATAAAATDGRTLQGVGSGSRKCGRRRSTGIGTSTVLVIALLAVLVGIRYSWCGRTVWGWSINDDIGLVDGVAGVGVHRACA